MPTSGCSALSDRATSSASVFERTDAELVALSLRALHPLVGITGEPLFTRVYRFERGNAQHEVGHLERVAAIDGGLARHPGIYITGSGFRGVGIPDCIADGRATARQAAAWLQPAAPHADTPRMQGVRAWGCAACASRRWSSWRRPAASTPRTASSRRC